MKYETLIKNYLAGPEILRRSVSGMSDEQINATPIPFKWSTRQVVFHISDFDLIYADHMKRVIAESEPMLLDGDRELFAARLAYDQARRGRGNPHDQGCPATHGSHIAVD